VTRTAVVGAVSDAAAPCQMAPCRRPCQTACPRPRRSRLPGKPSSLIVGCDEPRPSPQRWRLLLNTLASRATQRTSAWPETRPTAIGRTRPCKGGPRSGLWPLHSVLSTFGSWEWGLPSLRSMLVVMCGCLGMHFPSAACPQRQRGDRCHTEKIAGGWWGAGLDELPVSNYTRPMLTRSSGRCRSSSLTSTSCLKTFHYLPRATQRDFAIALKAFHEASDYVVVIVGVWPDENKLVSVQW
jgi:hypothetical protein